MSEIQDEILAKMEAHDRKRESADEWHRERTVLDRNAKVEQAQAKDRTHKRESVAIVFSIFCAMTAILGGIHINQIQETTRTCLEQNHSPEECGHP